LSVFEQSENVCVFIGVFIFYVFHHSELALFEDSNLGSSKNAVKFGNCDVEKWL